LDGGKQADATCVAEFQRGLGILAVERALDGELGRGVCFQDALELRMDCVEPLGNASAL
jgi:hypothetical protein